MVDRSQTVADLVLDHSECAVVFQRHRIDYCCRGNLSIETAAAQKGLDLVTLTGELAEAIRARASAAPADLRQLPTPRLIEHIVVKHHDYLRRTLPFMATLAAKVARVHGAQNPKLRELDAAVRELEGALLPHLDEEEQRLFPTLTSDAARGAEARAMLDTMHDDHLAVAELLTRVRSATEDFSLPSWACNSYRTLFSEMEKLEGDVFQHVHLENHVLKPRFVS